MAPKPNKRIDFLKQYSVLVAFYTCCIFTTDVLLRIASLQLWKDLLKTDLLFMSLYLNHCAVNDTDYDVTKNHLLYFLLSCNFH